MYDTWHTDGKCGETGGLQIFSLFSLDWNFSYILIGVLKILR